MRSVSIMLLLAQISVFAFTNAWADAIPDNPLPNCPVDFSAGKLGQSLTCACRVGSSEAGSVWGDGVYTADSAICRAARHAGVISEEGGAVLLTGEAGRSAYEGASRNGVESEAYDAYPLSFRLARTSGKALDVNASCPDNFTAYRGVGQPLRCVCAGEDTIYGTVWGTDIYSDDSGICRAGVHAGAIGPMGGSVTILGLPGRENYAGSEKHGIRSNDYQSWEGSFRFERTNASAPAAAGPVQAAVADSIARRGQVQLYITFATNSADLDARAQELLGQVRDMLRQNPSLSLNLVGHTDNVGSAAQNKPLSLRRAESVRAWLVGQGISATRLGVEGRGAEQPLADNATDAGRALNRRVTAIKK